MPSGQNTTAIMNMYKPFFVGSYAECKPGHFTYEPLSNEAANQNIKKMPRVVEWQHKRTCDAKCTANPPALPKEATAQAAQEPAHCCSECFADDWQNYPNYGGCRDCLHPGADPATQCLTCLKENVFSAVASTGVTCATDHCSSCKPGYAYPGDLSTGSFPKCVKCIRDINDQVCSGHGSCKQTTGYDTGLCECAAGWSGPSCSTPNATTCKNGILDAKGFCQCVRNPNPAGPHYGGVGCDIEHESSPNPLPGDDTCLVTTVTFDKVSNQFIAAQTKCANRGDCINQACSCYGHYNNSLRCTELNDDIIQTHHDLMCICDDPASGCNVQAFLSLLTKTEACKALDDYY